MNNEQHGHGHAAMAEIWRNANRRRAQDLRCWIINIFKKQWPFKSRVPETKIRLGETLLAPGDGRFASGAARMTGGQSG